MNLKNDMQSRAILKRMLRSLNEHDLDAFVECFATDYHSEQPVYPDRTFNGQDQVRKNWATFFKEVPDLKVAFLHSALEGDTLWVEMDYSGTGTEGEVFHMCGVAIFGVEQGLIKWGRLYMHPVVEGGGGINAAVQELTRKDE